MHADDITMDEGLIRQMLLEQVPQWAGLPLNRLSSSGTDNALFRLGEKLLLRLPRRQSAVPYLTKELDWLPRMAALPLKVPALRFRGRSNFGHLSEFGIFDWMEGEVASPENLSNPAAAALSLANFLTALQGLDTFDAPVAGAANNRRGIALAELTPVTMASIETLADEIRTQHARDTWHRACAANMEGAPVWLHGDLKAENMIARHGVLYGVIDWGLSAVGDPAADYAAAWTWLDPSAQVAFRNACGATDSDWLRAEAWALYGAVISLSYYRGGRNEAVCRQSRKLLHRLGLML